MQKWLVDLGLPNYNRLWVTLVVFSLFLALLSTILFGTIAAALLFIAFGVIYLIVCFVCYHPDGKEWRDKLDSYYQSLFIHAFSYVHSASSTSDSKTQLSAVGKGTDKNEPPTEKPQVQASKPCHREAQKIIQLIMRDFIHSWYGTVTSDLEFPDDVQKLLEHVVLETNVRMQKIDLEEIITEIATLVIPYLEVVNESGMRNYNNIEVFDVNSEKCLRAFENTQVVNHRALNTRDLELKYYRQALDALIQCAFPDKYQSCDLACTFVRELLLKNIIEPLFDLLCDPDFLLTSIPVILKKASPEKVQRELAEIRQENEELERKLSHGRLILKIKGSPVSQRRRFQLQSGRFSGIEQHSFTPTLAEASRVSPHLLRKQRAVSIQAGPASKAAASKRATWAFSTDSSDSFESPLEPSTYGTDYPQIGVEPEAYLPSSYSAMNGTSPPKEGAYGTWSNRSSTLTPSWNERPSELRENGRRISESDDTGWDVVEAPREEVPKGPIYFDRHVRVVSGSGNSSHIAYIFKFPKRMLNEDELRRLGVSEGDTHLEGMKRYSQFDKFNSSLLKTSMATHLKGISLPSKLSFSKLVSKLSFNREPDPVEIQERVQGLEMYLQSISAVTNIAESSQFHEFLISGIEALRQSNIVKPQAKAAKRKSFLGLRRGPSLPTFKEATQKAEPIPKRSVETVLSAYLDTHLPLPSHSLHTLHNLKPAPTSRPSSTHTPHTQDRRATLVNEAVITGSPSSSITSASSDIPLADLAATPKAAEYIHHSPRKIRLSVVGKSNSRGSVGTPDTDTDQSSVAGSSRGPTVPVEDEELYTIGSSTSLSSSSFVSVSEELKPSGTEVQTNDPVSSANVGAVNVQTEESHTSSQFSPLKARLLRLYNSLVFYLTLIYNMVLKGSNPVTPDVSFSLAEEHTQRIPLTNSLLALGSEASRRHCPELWACHENTQLAILVLTGGGIERYMWKELKELVYSDENWSRALYHLRHTLWPNGEFRKGSSSKLTEEQRKEIREEAVAAIKKFLPNLLPVVVGRTDYDNAVNHVLDCLQNPKVTRYFILRLVDVFLIKLIPELSTKEFQKQLAHLRTITPPPRNRFSVRPT